MVRSERMLITKFTGAANAKQTVQTGLHASLSHHMFLVTGSSSEFAPDVVQGATLRHSEHKALLLPGAEVLVRILRKVARVILEIWDGILKTEHRTRGLEKGSG